MSRPGSRHSSRPGSSAGRAPAHAFEQASVDVPMGGMAFVDKSSGAYTMITSVGGAASRNGTTLAGKRGASTRGLTACFAVAVIGSGGAILAHVSAYLGHAQLTPAQRAELDAMTRGFATLFNRHKAALTPCTIAVIDGENTNSAERQALLRRIFAPLFEPRFVPSTRNLPLACERTPYPRTAAHGTVTVLLAPDNQLYVEDRKKL